MDPNLEKIKNFRLKEIKQGRTNRVLNEGKNYLMYLHRYNYNAVVLEFKKFRRTVLSI